MVNKKSSTQKSKSKQIPEEIGSPSECSVEVEGGQGKEGECTTNVMDDANKSLASATTSGSKKRGKAAVRSSNRVPKKVKKEISPPTSPVKKQGKIKSTTPDGKRTTGRKWELWSKQDQQLFYDGLFEFGKDFDSIYRYISIRQKKRGCVPEMLKNKDQIRHFYYRAWHKISKWIVFKDGIKKSMQEVYALINYGEFRKRVPGGLNPKLGDKLNELFHTGVTNVKVKGKIHKLRTPVCRALKKINNIEEPKEEELALQLPDEIVVELRPRTNKEWAYVHSMSQNPRLRMHVKPDRRLSSLLNCAQKKWRPPTSRIREILCLTPTTTPRLRLAPMGEITPISLKINPPNKRMDMGLDVVKANLREISVDQLRKFAERRKKQKLEEQTRQEDVVEYSDQVDLEREMKSPDLKLEVDVKQQDPIPEIPGRCSLESLELGDSRSREPHDAESEGARLETDELVNLGGVCAITVECMESENVEISPEELTSLEDKFRTGWTDFDAHEITIAEIYLILNEPEKVYLQYDFVDESSAVTLSQDQGCQNGAKTKMATAMESLLLVARTQFINLAKLNKQAQLLSCAQCACAAQSDGSPSANRLRHNMSPGTPKQTLKRGASPAQGRSTQRRGSNAKSKKELDMSAAASQSQEQNQPELPVIAPAPVNEFRIPALPIPARPLAPAGPRVLEPMGQRPMAPENFLVNTSAFQSRNFLQHLDPMTKRSIAPLARNKMRLKQIRPRNLLAKPPVNRQLLSMAMVPGPDSVQKGFMPIIPGVVARHIGPVPVNATTIDGANTTDLRTVIGVKPDDVNMLMANMVPLSQQQPSSSVFQQHPPEQDTTPVSTMTDVSSDVPASSEDSNQSFMSSMLDISLPPPDPGIGDSDSLIDMALNNNPSFSQYLNDRVLYPSLPTSCSTPSQSPLKLPDYFLNAESGDLSLGAILDSPVKRDVPFSAPSSVNLFNDSSRDSISNKFESQVDTTLQFMMNESSVDYISKFADLAAQIAASADNDNQKNDHVT